MSDLITIVCPKCGGNLTVTPSTTSSKCPYCGVEYVLQNNAGTYTLESFAQCPRCGRNDEVRKLSAIVKSGIQHLDGHTIQSDHYQDNEGHWRTTTSQVPFSGTQITELAQKLAPPKQPEAMGVGCHWGAFYVYGALAAMAGIGYLIISMQGYDYSTGSYEWVLSPLNFIAAIGLLAVAVFLIRQYVRSLKHFKKIREDDKRDLPHRVEIWRQAVQKWEGLYYCFRDDCIFDPKERVAFEISELNAHLFPISTNGPENLQP